MTALGPACWLLTGWPRLASCAAFTRNLHLAFGTAKRTLSASCPKFGCTVWIDTLRSRKGVRTVPSYSSPGIPARNEEQHRHDLCLIGRWMYERGYIVAGEGNLSVRLDADRILTTPTCINKGMMTPSDLVVMDMEGRHLQGDRKISSEAGMHLLFYRMRSDVQPVCHGHPPTPTGFAVPAQSFDQALLPKLASPLRTFPLFHST